jgi:hypothetical protein
VYHLWNINIHQLICCQNLYTFLSSVNSWSFLTIQPSCDRHDNFELLLSVNYHILCNFENIQNGIKLLQTGLHTMKKNVHFLELVED